MKSQAPEAQTWERLARQVPFWAVLTEERFRDPDDADVEAFYATGRTYATSLLVLIRAAVPGFRTDAALDFGCGVGRITLALTEHFSQVTGVDVSGTMLELAHRRAREKRIENLQLIEGSVSELPRGRFDLVSSYIVLQHLPVDFGLQAFDALLDRVAPGGVAAIQLTFLRPGGRFRKLLRNVRHRLPLAHRVANLLQGRPWDEPYMLVSEYDRENLLHRAAASGLKLIAEEPTVHGDARGALLVLLRVDPEAAPAIMRGRTKEES
jgi:SAM-dependent methyltransferase